MTEKDIVRLAEEAELWLHTDRKYEAVEKFANLVAAAVRESTASPQRENEFTPDWDSMAVMVEEQQRMAKRIQVLEAALAQPEPKPFEYWNAVEGWVKIDEVRQHFDTAGCGTIYKTGGEGRVPLYTTPQREWVGLTDEEIEQCAIDDGSDDLIFARAIEAKLKEKNAC